MQAHRDTVLATTAWAIAGGVFSLLILFLVLDTSLPATLMTAAAPVTLALLTLDVMRHRPVVHSTVAPRSGAPAPAPATPAGIPVTVTAVKVEGACPLGYQVQVGDRWRIGTAVQGPPLVCPRIEKAVRRAAAQLAEGRPHGDEVRCAGPGHRVIFTLQGDGGQRHALYSEDQPVAAVRGR